MKKKSLIFPLTLFSLMFSVSGCSKGNGDSIVLRILNMEDYIYVNNPADGYDEPNIYDEQFIEYIRNSEVYGPMFEGKEIRVVYDTTDTNETLYSELQTGKAYYDVICPSDYMIQKLISNDMLVPFNKSLIPNYYGDGEEFNGYASQYIRNALDEITSKSYSTQKEYSLGDYAVCYMWGTLGLLFNPEYGGFAKEATPFDDMQEWSSLWSSKYTRSFSIKDSMRDTYAVGVIETYKKELLELKERHELDEQDPNYLDDLAYNQEISKIFNRCEKKYSDEVKVTLSSLKDNAFGLEVDSGKQDIVTKKIGLNLAWSGDAVYSMDQAEDDQQVTDPFELYYAVPEIGSNIWFDAWVMPDTSRTQDQYLLAHAFMNFLCDPLYAAKNMDYTGYTSVIGGDAILDLVRDWYDYRTDLIYNPGENEEYYSLFYVDPYTEELSEIWYEDCHFKDDEDSSYDGIPLYYGFCDYDEDGNLLNLDTGEPLTIEDLTLFDEETYNERLVIDQDEEVSIETVDLTYFFEGTLDEYDEEDMIFYTDCYLPFKEESGNISVGRQFFCQYPDLTTITRCAVMKDYRENNTQIMAMWEEFKSNYLPTWAIILFAAEAVVILGAVGLYFVNKNRKKSIRKNRKK